MKKNFVCLVVMVTGMVTSGCGLAPPDAPFIKCTTNSTTIEISWDAVPGAEEYYLYQRPVYVGETSADPESLGKMYMIVTSTSVVFRKSGFRSFTAVKAANAAGVSGFSNVVASN